MDVGCSDLIAKGQVGLPHSPCVFSLAYSLRSNLPLSATTNIHLDRNEIRRHSHALHPDRPGFQRRHRDPRLGNNLLNRIRWKHEDRRRAALRQRSRLKG